VVGAVVGAFVGSFVGAFVVAFMDAAVGCVVGASVNAVVAFVTAEVSIGFVAVALAGLLAAAGLEFFTVVALVDALVGSSEGTNVSFSVAVSVASVGVSVRVVSVVAAVVASELIVSGSLQPVNTMDRQTTVANTRHKTFFINKQSPFHYLCMYNGISRRISQCTYPPNNPTTFYMLSPKAIYPATELW
jgi:hypothetical protein